MALTAGEAINRPPQGSPEVTAQQGAIGLPRRLYRATEYGLKVHDAYQLLREALALRPAEAQA